MPGVGIGGLWGFPVSEVVVGRVFCVLLFLAGLTGVADVIVGARSDGSLWLVVGTWFATLISFECTCLNYHSSLLEARKARALVGRPVFGGRFPREPL